MPYFLRLKKPKNTLITSIQVERTVQLRKYTLRRMSPFFPQGVGLVFRLQRMCIVHTEEKKKVINHQYF